MIKSMVFLGFVMSEWKTFFLEDFSVIHNTKRIPISIMECPHRKEIYPYMAIAERFMALKAEFEAQLVEEKTLNQAIADNLAKVQI